MTRLSLCGDFDAHPGMWGSSQTDTNGKVLVSLLNKHDYVLLNSSSPNHFSFTGHSFWSLLDLTTVSYTIASNCSTTVTNMFFGSDHYIIHTTVNGVELTDTQLLSKWNFAEANRPKLLTCVKTLLSFYPNLKHSYQLFETCVREAYKEFILQTKRCTKISVPWWNQE